MINDRTRMGALTLVECLGSILNGVIDELREAAVGLSAAIGVFDSQGPSDGLW